MVNAVILAGGKKKEYKAVSSWIYRNLLGYGRRIPGEEKAVMMYKGKPMVSHVINALANAKTIDDIVVVGNVKFLEKAGINNVGLLEQDTSLVENALIGYNYFKERGYGGKLLFAPCDIPEVKSEAIDEFVNKSNEGDFCLAVGEKEVLGEYDPIFRRFYFWVIKDGERKKYRLNNLIVAEPDCINNKEMVEYAFCLRNILDVSKWLKIANLTGWQSFFDYFTFRLNLESIEDKLSNKFGCDFRIVEMKNPSSSFDLDYRRDSWYLRKWHKLMKRVKA